MARENTYDRLNRLDLLTSRLKADELMTIGMLASEFGVSRRTLSRDIAILRDRGLPIEADAGRGGRDTVAPDMGRRAAYVKLPGSN